MRGSTSYHAEVEGLMGFAGSLGQVVSNEADVKNMSLSGPYIIVSQTTQDDTAFENSKYFIPSCLIKFLTQSLLSI